MAFGLPASYEHQCDLAGNRQAAREAILYTFGILDWKYELADPDLFRAKVPASGTSWGEIFTVSLATPGVAEIRSGCRSPLQVFDWGKNKQNVRQFRAHFSQKEIREARLGYGEPTYLDEAGDTPVDRLLKESVVRDPE